MASSKQVVAILDDHFNLAGTGRYHAEFLRTAGVLPSTPGRPEPLASEHIALLLLSVMLGEPCAADHPDRVLRYAALSGGAVGPTLGKALAGFVDVPHDLFELRLDLGTPSASMTLRQANRGMATVAFSSPDARHTGVERYAVIDGNTMTRISAAISNAPEIRAGRRRRHRK